MIFLYIVALVILWVALDQDLSDAQELRLKEMENWANTCELRMSSAYSLLRQKKMELCASNNRIKFLEEEQDRLKEQIRILEFKLNPHKTTP